MYKKSKIRIRVTNEVKSKLAFVKIIKEYTGLGLKKSKDHADVIIDSFSNGSNEFEEIEVFLLDEFERTLRDNDIKCVIVGGVQWQRDYKILELGLGDVDDYRNFISTHLYDKDIMNSLSENLIKEIFNEISKKIKDDSNL